MTDSTSKNEGARSSTARLDALREKQLRIAEVMTTRALVLIESGDDVRSNDSRPGLATLQHAVQSAVGEIVRLTPICKSDEQTSDATQHEVILRFADAD